METTPLIFVIEDEPAMRVGIEMMLKNEDYDVICTANGQEAINYLEQEKIVPDLIISDVMMPHMNGFEFYKRLRGNPQYAAIPFIFLTARSGKDDIREGKEMGVDDYLMKPFDPPDLFATIRGKLKRTYELKQSTARKTDQIKTGILRNLRHEILTPMTTIQGWTDLLVKPNINYTSEELEEWLSMINYAGKRITHLIDNFTQLIQLQSDSGQLLYKSQFHRLELNGMVTSAVQLFQQESKIEINLNCQNEHYGIRASSELLVKAIVCLLDNARKFIPSENTPQINVNTFREEMWVGVSIHDNGIGIPVEAVPYIFEPFYQHDRETYEQQGMGVGLAIVKQIVDLHGGKIGVDSIVDNGATVSLYFPEDYWNEDD